MSIWHSFIFGIVEGLTEFLPISSTGHLILTAKVLGQTHTDFLKSFEIAIQLGAILAVVVVYIKVLTRGIDIWFKIMAAFLPTAAIGLMLYPVVKKYLLGNQQIVIWSLFLGGIVLIVFELLYKEKETALTDIKDVSYKQAFVIGIIQSFAIVPGVSRSAATIIGGLALGLKRKTIVEFSFLLAVPTMFAAVGFDLLKSAYLFSRGELEFLTVGFLVSFIVAIMSIKFLLFYIKRYNFIGFGIYRILVSSFFMLFM